MTKLIKLKTDMNWKYKVESFFEGGISFNMELGVLRRFGANTSGTVKSN